MIYFISELQNGMVIREEVTSQYDLDIMLDHHIDNEIYKSCILYAKFDNVPVAINVKNMSDDVIFEYQRMH